MTPPLYSQSSIFVLAIAEIVVYIAGFMVNSWVTLDVGPVKCGLGLSGINCYGFVIKCPLVCFAETINFSEAFIHYPFLITMLTSTILAITKLFIVHFKFSKITTSIVCFLSFTSVSCCVAAAVIANMVFQNIEFIKEKVGYSELSGYVYVLLAFAGVNLGFTCKNVTFWLVDLIKKRVKNGVTYERQNDEPINVDVDADVGRDREL